MENYLEVWRVLDELVNVIKGKGGNVPKGVISELRSAKALINMFNLDKTKLETLTKIESHLGNIEQTLLYIAESDVNRDLADTYLKKILEARGKQMIEQKMPSRFIPAIPRDQHWIRVRIDEDINKSEVKVLSDELDLSLKEQDEDHVIIYGDKEKIKNLIQKMAERRK